ncbi:hypothetical protein [Acuticoccus yangtzensis]|uniref:hypothetical protein n=1 Tax=Acuticoccus yangtzensis TaxID=1443441 RepID=UPI000A8022E4|nr:hypothetical protein [Acuticoccus yangtzensis]
MVASLTCGATTVVAVELSAVAAEEAGSDDAPGDVIEAVAVDVDGSSTVVIPERSDESPDSSVVTFWSKLPPVTAVATLVVAFAAATEPRRMAFVLRSFTADVAVPAAKAFSAVTLRDAVAL